MQQLPYARPELLEAYPGRGITEEQKASVDDYTAEVEEILTDPALVIYGLARSVSAAFSNVFARVEAAIGEEQALAIAEDFGRTHGTANYRRFLESRNLAGGPRAMCEYQDWAHALRGPRQATALFASFDDTSVVVERTDCVYYFGERGAGNKYVEAIERGMMHGYTDVDPTLSHVENDRCLCKGSAEGCRHRFVFRSAPAD
jgi:hypothetical protein